MAKVPAMQTGKGAVGAMTTGDNPALVPVKPAGGKPTAAPAKKSGKAKSQK